MKRRISRLIRHPAVRLLRMPLVARLMYERADECGVPDASALLPVLIAARPCAQHPLRPDVRIRVPVLVATGRCRPPAPAPLLSRPHNARVRRPTVRAVRGDRADELRKAGPVQRDDVPERLCTDHTRCGAGQAPAARGRSRPPGRRRLNATSNPECRRQPRGAVSQSAPAGVHTRC
jgi:hypothetical protein